MKKGGLKQYATALASALEEPNADVDTVLKHFVAVLAHDGVLAKADRIIELFEAHQAREQGRMSVRLTTARETSDAVQKKLAHHLAETLSKKHIDIEAQTDASLIGGAIIEYDDVRIDGSLRRRLEQMKHALTNS